MRTFFASLVCAFAIASAACSSSSSDAVDGGQACSATTSCPSGSSCWYAVDGGCDAIGHCVVNPTQPNTGCKAASFCACDGTLAPECGPTAGSGLSDRPLHGAHDDSFCGGDAG